MTLITTKKFAQLSCMHESTKNSITHTCKKKKTKIKTRLKI
jgi:hypothetical protein